MYIAFFDVLSVKKTDSQRTKSDPHWSSVNGTYAMLQHDFAHIDAMIDSYSNDSRSLKYIKEVCKIQKIYREEENLNDATVLMNGLFMIHYIILPYTKIQNLYIVLNINTDK